MTVCTVLAYHVFFQVCTKSTVDRVLRRKTHKFAITYICNLLVEFWSLDALKQWSMNPHLTKDVIQIQFIKVNTAVVERQPVSKTNQYGNSRLHQLPKLFSGGKSRKIRGSFFLYLQTVL